MTTAVLNKYTNYKYETLNGNSFKLDIMFNVIFESLSLTPWYLFNSL